MGELSTAPAGSDRFHQEGPLAQTPGDQVQVPGLERCCGSVRRERHEKEHRRFLVPASAKAGPMGDCQPLQLLLRVRGRRFQHPGRQRRDLDHQVAGGHPNGDLILAQRSGATRPRRSGDRSRPRRGGRSRTGRRPIEERWGWGAGECSRRRKECRAPRPVHVPSSSSASIASSSSVAPSPVRAELSTI